MRPAVYPIHAPANQKQAWSTISLENLLSGRSSGRPRLWGSDKRRLALALASSVLGLYQTPWLTQDLHSLEIIFLQRPGKSLFGSAFLARPRSTQGLSSASAGHILTLVTSNQTLFNLGVLLIELGLGRRVDVSEFRSISQLTLQVEEECGGRYATAVNGCIWRGFDCSSSDLEDEQFSAAVYTGVVSVLEEDLNQFLTCLS